MDLDKSCRPLDSTNYEIYFKFFPPPAVSSNLYRKYTDVSGGRNPLKIVIPNRSHQQ